MSDSIRYHPEVDKLEHDDVVSPESKRVSIYGWDTENLNKVRVAVDGSGGIVIGKDTSGDCASRTDVSSTDIVYMGEAPIGSSTADAVWQIAKLDLTDASENALTWADGDSDFDNIWDNRASLSYS